MKNKPALRSRLLQCFILTIAYLTVQGQKVASNSKPEQNSNSVGKSNPSMKNKTIAPEDGDSADEFTSEYEKMNDENTILHKLDKESEAKSHNRLTRDLIIIKTPSKCWNPSSFSIFNPRPDSRPGFNQSDLILQTPEGEMEDFELGQILSHKYRKFIESIQSPSRIYAFAANTSCHYSSVYNTLAGMLLGVKNQEVYSDTYETLELAPGGKHNYYVNMNNYALYHGFYPVAIRSDHSDHLYQIRTCERLKITIDHTSHFTMLRYKKEVILNEALAEVYRNNKHLAQLYKEEEFKFENMEYIYEELLLRGLLSLIQDWDQRLISLMYHLYMYARYFSEDMSTTSIMEPFIHRMLKKLRKYESQTTTKRVKHKKRLLVFSASQKIMIGMHHLLFGVNHEKLFALVKNYIENKDIGSNGTLEHIEKDKGVVMGGTNLILEIYKAKEEKQFQGGEHKNLTFHHSPNLDYEPDTMISGHKGNVFYAVRGRLNGKKVKICGEDFEGECNMEQFVDFLWSKVNRVRPDKCEKKV